MLVDSHCHLDFPELLSDLDGVRQRMVLAGVREALCVSVTLETLPLVLDIASRCPEILASVGVHPDEPDATEPSGEQLVDLARHPRVVAIGETGLDYYRNPAHAPIQQARFRTHIRAARACQLPLIIHTRSAGEDTLRLLREEGAQAVGGVIHCFTETWDFAREALALGFYVSFSGIVTFRNAAALRDVARQVPLDRLLVETDSPYLAPVPHRGRSNEPAFVREVAQQVAEVRGLGLEVLAQATTENFHTLFRRR